MSDEVIILRLAPQSDGTCRVLSSTPHGNMAWSLGIDFPDRDAAYRLACVIGDNIAGRAVIEENAK